MENSSFPFHGNSTNGQWTNMQIIVTTLYLFTASLALAGNSLSAWVLINGSKTALYKYLLNLTAADICMAVFCIPFTFTQVIFKTWLLPEFLCPIVNFFQVVGVTISIFTNVAVGIDRLIAVRFPLYQNVTSRSNVVLFIIWFTSIIIAIPAAICTRVTGLFDNTDSKFCTEIWSATLRKVYTLFLLITNYFFPLTTLCLTYTFIGIILWRRKVPGVALRSRDEAKTRSSKKVIKVLVVITVAFAVCWAPLNFFHLINHFKPKVISNKYEIYSVIFLSAHWTAMAHSTVNPFVYCFLSDTFWADLWNLLEKQCNIRKKRNYTMTRMTHSSILRTSSKNLESKISRDQSCELEHLKSLKS